MKNDKVFIFDTTLRDGEQSPGASMKSAEKLPIAFQLAKFRVDVIEAGFPITSDGDFAAVSAIAAGVRGPTIAALARCVQKDIDCAAEALKAAEKKRIHVFLATSKIHMDVKLKKSAAEVIEMAVGGVKHALTLVEDVEFSPEDASRTDPDFLVQVCRAVTDAGATVVNIPDTVGYAMPQQFGQLIAKLKREVPRFASNHSIISVHCHDDLGLAVANSLAAISAGARQVEGTINGIGERAGNAALEEVVMALKTRADYFDGLDCGVETREIMRTSRIVSRFSGFFVPRNKAVVGENAFAHSSGIHQHGMLSNRSTYEVIDCESVGWGQSELPLTKHSGRAAVFARLTQLGFVVSDAVGTEIFEGFKALGDKKKSVTDDDLFALVASMFAEIPDAWSLNYMNASSGGIATATISLKRNGNEVKTDASIGDGPVDAALNAIKRITGSKGKLKDYVLRATSEGGDALGEVRLKVEFGDGRGVVGSAANTDVVKESAQAFLNALNA